MLEYPEAKTIAKQIEETLIGRTIVEVVLEQTPHKFAFFTAGKENYPSLLMGETVRGARGIGGIAEIDTDRRILYFSDGASPRYYPAGEKPPKKHQFLLRFADGSCLAVSIQMYGFIGLADLPRCEDKYYRLAADSPDPLGEDFTYGHFKSLYPKDGPKLTAKAFLATEQRVPGLGNGVLQDILWNANVNPRTDMKTLSEEDFQRLYEATRATLREMRELGGRDTQKDLFGNPGGYPTRLCNETLGAPCPRCGASIAKESYMGGAVYYCEGCQKK